MRAGRAAGTSDAGPRPSRTLVVQPNMDGHRFNYVRLLLESVEDAALIVLATTPEGLATYREKTGDVEGPLMVFCSAAPSVREIEVLGRRIGADTVVVLDGDAYCPRLLARGGWRGRGVLRLLVMREYGQPRRIGDSAAVRTLAKRALFTASHALPRVEVAILASAARRDGGRIPRVQDPISYAPDASTADRLWANVRLADDMHWCLVVGKIDSRKNIGMVAEAISLAQSLSHARLGLVLAGSQSSDVRPEVDHARALSLTLVVDDRHLSERELDSYIDLADIVVLAHSNDGPSGIMGKAAAAGKKILAAGSRSLARDCAALGAGSAWTPLDPVRMAEGLVALEKLDAGVTPRSYASEDFARTLLEPATRRGTR